MTTSSGSTVVDAQALIAEQAQFAEKLGTYQRNKIAGILRRRREDAAIPHRERPSDSARATAQNREAAAQDAAIHAELDDMVGAPAEAASAPTTGAELFAQTLAAQNREAAAQDAAIHADLEAMVGAPAEAEAAAPTSVSGPTPAEESAQSRPAATAPVEDEGAVEVGAEVPPVAARPATPLTRAAEPFDIMRELKRAQTQLGFVDIDSKDLKDSIPLQRMVELNADIQRGDFAAVKELVRQQVVDFLASEAGAPYRDRVHEKLDAVCDMVAQTVQAELQAAIGTELSRGDIAQMAPKIVTGILTGLGVAAGTAFVVGTMGAGAIVAGAAAGAATAAVRFFQESKYGKSVSGWFKKTILRQEQKTPAQIQQEARDRLFAPDNERRFQVSDNHLAALISNAIRTQTSPEAIERLRGLAETRRGTMDRTIGATPADDMATLARFDRALGTVSRDFFKNALEYARATYPDRSVDEQEQLALCITSTISMYEHGSALGGIEMARMQVDKPAVFTALEKFLGLRSGRLAMSEQDERKRQIYMAGSVLIGAGTAAAIRASDIGRIVSGALAGAGFGISMAERAAHKAELAQLQELQLMLNEAETSIQDVIREPSFPEPQLVALNNRAKICEARLREGLLENNPLLKQRAENFIFRVRTIEIREHQQLDSLRTAMEQRNEAVSEQMKVDIKRIEAKGGKQWIYAAVGAAGGALLSAAYVGFQEWRHVDNFEDGLVKTGMSPDAADKFEDILPQDVRDHIVAGGVTPDEAQALKQMHDLMEAGSLPQDQTIDIIDKLSTSGNLDTVTTGKIKDVLDTATGLGQGYRDEALKMLDMEIGDDGQLLQDEATDIKLKLHEKFFDVDSFDGDKVSDIELRKLVDAELSGDTRAKAVLDEWMKRSGLIDETRLNVAKIDAYEDALGIDNTLSAEEKLNMLRELHARGADPDKLDALRKLYGVSNEDYKKLIAGEVPEEEAAAAWGRMATPGFSVEPHAYTGGRHVWGEIENQFRARSEFSHFAGLSEGERTYAIDYLKDKVVAHPEQYGLPPGTDADNLTQEQLAKINWDKLFSEAKAEQGSVFAKLSPAQIENIEHNNELLREWRKENPTAPLTSENVNDIIEKMRAGRGRVAAVEPTEPVAKEPQGAEIEYNGAEHTLTINNLEYDVDKNVGTRRTIDGVALIKGNDRITIRDVDSDGRPEFTFQKGDDHPETLEFHKGSIEEFLKKHGFKKWLKNPSVEFDRLSGSADIPERLAVDGSKIFETTKRLTGDNIVFPQAFLDLPVNQAAEQHLGRGVGHIADALYGSGKHPDLTSAQLAQMMRMRVLAEEVSGTLDPKELKTFTFADLFDKLGKDYIEGSSEDMNMAA